jgi:addiction module HigA family antidote
MKRNRRPTAPGTILRKYYLTPRQISVAQLATAAGISRKHASNITNNKASITPEVAYRLGKVLNTTPQFWINLQNAVSLHDVHRRLATWRPAEVHPSAVSC